MEKHKANASQTPCFLAYYSDPVKKSFDAKRDRTLLALPMPKT
jgi:hypothetical protein